MTATEEQKTSLWDMIPVIAQGKSLFQLVFGDKEGALKTQEHFLNEGLGTSQFRSAYFLFTGEPQKALNIQGKFFSNLEQVVDSLPVVGHIKAGIHLIVGDDDHGWHAMKSATSTGGAIVGGIIGGPFGAISGHLMTDLAITGVDAALNGNKSKPHGTIGYVIDINKLKPGDHFDMIASVILDAKAGKKLEAKRDKNNIGGNFNRKESIELQPLMEETNFEKNAAKTSNVFHAIADKNTKRLKSIASRITSYTSRRELPDESLLLKYNAFKDFLKHDPTYNELGLHKIWTKEIDYTSIRAISFDGLDNFRNDNYLDNLDVDSVTNKLGYLTRDEQSLINKYDFRTINTDFTKPNCLSCSLAGALNINLETLEKNIMENLEPDDTSLDVDLLDTDTVLESLKKSKLIDYSVSAELEGTKELNTYLKLNALRLVSKHIILEGFIDMDQITNGIMGHAVALKLKLLEDSTDPVKLTIDYQMPGFVRPGVPNPFRFQPILNPVTYKTFFVNEIELLKQ